MSVSTGWKPNNRNCVRICAVFYRALQKGQVELSYQDALRVQRGCMANRFNHNVRAYIGQMWIDHGGLALARRTDQIDRIPADMRDALDTEKLSA